jgi:serine/threonine protein kinase
LKPSNILITRIGHDVKLIDLGYCYADCYTDTMGRTDKYAAPEQMDGSAKPDARTDIYAIGRILQTLPCTRYYNKVIKRCTEENPGERYQSIAELETAISRKRPYWLLVVILMIVIVLSVVLFWWNPFLKSQSPSLQHHVEDSSIPDKRESGVSQKGVFGDIQGQSSAIEDSPSQQPSLTPQTTIPQQTDAFQDETHSAKSETPVSEAGLPKADPPVNETQSPSSSYTDADVAQLRRLLHEAIRPIYEKHLGAYRNIDYHGLNQTEIEAYGHQDVAFMEDCMRKHHELWQKYQQQYDKALFADEFEKIRESYDAQVFLPSRNK